MQTFREKLKTLVEKPLYLQVITILIVLNSIILGMKSYPHLMESYGHLLDELDEVMIVIFVCELLSYLIIYGPRHCFTDPWYVFDAAVILVAIISTEPAFSSLRAMRVLRILRLITIFPNLRKVVQGLIAAIPGIGSIVTILLIVLYVSALMSTTLYGAEFPKYFGTLQQSVFTLFQIMTAESWASNIARPVMEVHPYSWVFFIIFICSTTFIVLNLFIGVIVNAMQKDIEHQEGEESKLEALQDIKKLLKKIDKKVNAK